MCFYDDDLESLKDTVYDTQYTEILNLKKMSAKIHITFFFKNQQRRVSN